MATLNEVKYAAMAGVLTYTDPIHLNELEHLYLDDLGAAAGGTVNERWYKVFAASSGFGGWTQAAAIWMTKQGIDDEKINTMWYNYWQLVDPGDPTVQASQWVPALSGVDGVYDALPTGSLSPNTFGGQTITFLGSTGPAEFTVTTAAQIVGVTVIRVSVSFSGKTRQADLAWNGTSYVGVMANARELSVLEIGNTTPVVLRQL